MYTIGSLHSEIERLFRHRIEAGEIVRKEWVCHELLLRYPLPDFPDADFTECCRRAAVMAAVNKVNSRFKEDAEKRQGELPLPGYVYLQKAYLVERDSETLLVPLPLMTSAERRAKAALYREMANGCNGHADELDRFDELTVSEAA